MKENTEISQEHLQSLEVLRELSDDALRILGMQDFCFDDNWKSHWGDKETPLTAYVKISTQLLRIIQAERKIRGLEAGTDGAADDDFLDPEEEAMLLRFESNL